MVSAGLLGGEPRREPLRFDSDGSPGCAGPGCQFSSSPPQSSSAPHELCGRWCDFDAAETLPFDPEPNDPELLPDAPGATGLPISQSSSPPSLISAQSSPFDIAARADAGGPREAVAPSIRQLR